MPIEVTLSGITIELKELQPLKASSPIEVTLSGIIVVAQPVIKVLVEVSIIALQSSLESYKVFPSFTMIDLKERQPEKASLPIEVTLSGITIELNEGQLEKADLPIEVTPFPIVTKLKDVQPTKAEAPIEVTLSGIKIELKEIQQ